MLPTLAADSADLIVTDPPYGQNWHPSTMRTRPLPLSHVPGDDGIYNPAPAVGIALRALRHGRHVYVFGHFDLSTLPLGGLTELIWDKGIIGMGGGDSPWGPQHEYIQFGVHSPSQANRLDGKGNGAARLRRGSVLRFNRLNSGQVATHPTEKPIPLLRELIESSSRIGETVLDPFAGVGSTLVAARVEGRRAIGIEIEERFCEVAAKRLAQETLFGPPSPPPNDSGPGMPPVEQGEPQ